VATIKEEKDLWRRPELPGGGMGEKGRGGVTIVLNLTAAFFYNGAVYEA
jgi:hypothetical protein